VLHLTYTRRDLPQQLVQHDHLTPALYDRMSPAHRYLLDIEGPRPQAAPRREAGTRTWSIAEPQETAHTR
jgi:hypothetical protein